MANSYKILGQLEPTPNALTNLYVTGASASAIVSALTITNLTDSNSSYSLVVRPINESLGDKHYIIRGATLNSNVILAANTNGTNVSFQAYGAEIT